MQLMDRIEFDLSMIAFKISKERTIFIFFAMGIVDFFFFLVGYVEERPWWPIQSPNTGGEERRKRAAKRIER